MTGQSPLSLRKNGPRGLSRTGRVRPVTAGSRVGGGPPPPSGVVPRGPGDGVSSLQPVTSAGDREAMPYPHVDPQPKLPELEQHVLERWQHERTFEASVENRPPGERGSNEYVFYGGPPFANGLPHYGHLPTGFVKDAVPRYQTMRGRRVERRFGWDCHGLPAEVEAERQLGISGKPEIEEYGVARFNDACRT